MSKLSDAIESGRFVVTSEIGPPKGINTQAMWDEAERLRDKVVAVNVTDNQSSVMRIGSPAVCKGLLERGLEPVLQVTCRDRNRLALQSDLLGAAMLGIENVLALTGDHTLLGDHPEAKPVFDLDSVSLLGAMSMLEEGTDLAGNALDGAPKFFKGAVAAPCADNVELQIIKLEKKVEAGAQFIQTQAVYDPAAFERFMERITHIKVPVLVGILMLKSPKQAEYMNKNVAGVHVPEALIKEIADTDEKDRRKKSVEIAVRLIERCRPMCRGAHIMPLGWGGEVPKIIDGLGPA